MKDNFLFNTSLFNKSVLTFACNPYFEKESLDINNKTGNFI